MKSPVWGMITVVIVVASLWNCSENKMIKKTDPDPQASVKITLNDGSVKQGIIFKGNARQIVYVDAQSHKPDSIAVGGIQSIERLPIVYDYEANEIPEQEIKRYKSHKYMLLYGFGGLVLGGAAGWGISVAAFANKSNGATLARATIAGLGLAGAAIFGYNGSKADRLAAIPKARKARFKKLQRVVEEEKKIRELKKKKEELLRKIEMKKKAKKGTE